MINYSRKNQKDMSNHNEMTSDQKSHDTDWCGDDIFLTSIESVYKHHIISTLHFQKVNIGLGS